MKNYKEFPKSLEGRVYSIYPRKKVICIDGFKYFKLTDLKNVDLSIRLSYPPDLFAAINKS